MDCCLAWDISLGLKTIEGPRGSSVLSQSPTNAYSQSGFECGLVPDHASL